MTKIFDPYEEKNLEKKIGLGKGGYNTYNTNVYNTHNILIVRVIPIEYL